MLETRYLPTLGTNKLKEVDGYKIRLITVDELTSNLECTNNSCESSQYTTWVYQHFGDLSKNTSRYWTMSEVTDYSSSVWVVDLEGLIVDSNVLDYDNGVRPVINLLKFSIH